MTAGDERLRAMGALTSEEREALWEAIESAFLDTTTWSRVAEDAIDAAVERIVAARVAAALAEARSAADPCFCRAVPSIGGGGCGKPGCPRGPLADLSAAAEMVANTGYQPTQHYEPPAAPTTAAPQPEPGGGESCVECGGVVDRVLPDPIPEGYECMWSEAMAGRALYCGDCYGEMPAEAQAEPGGGE